MLNWTQIKGHQRNKEVLSRALENNRLHHALLFAGPDGVGKRLLANALAASINCINRQEDEFKPACGTCVSCHKVWQNIHPDMHLVEPQGNVIKRIKISQIREIQKAATMPPYEAREQVVVILDAHLMGEEASNALLKTLEEPSGRMRMILTTDQPHLLLDTILSRCQLFRFGAITREDVSEILARLIQETESLQQYKGQEKLLDIAAAFGEGSVGKSLEILESGLLHERSELIDKLKSLRPRNPIDYLQLAENMAKDKEKKALLMERLDAIKVFLRDVMRAQAAQGSTQDAVLINTDMKQEVLRWANAYSTQDTLDRIDAIHDAQELIRRNVNPQLVMERTLRKLKPNQQQAELIFSRR